MGTRKSLRNGFSLTPNNKLGLKASLAEVMHDIEQMTNQPANRLLKKQPRFSEIDLYDPKKRTGPEGVGHIGAPADVLADVSAGVDGVSLQPGLRAVVQDPAERPQHTPGKPAVKRLDRAVPDVQPAAS